MFHNALSRWKPAACCQLHTVGSMNGKFADHTNIIGGVENVEDSLQSQNDIDELVIWQNND